jgi:hypothetical protein
MASTYLTRTPSSNGNLDKWTLSVWVKRGDLEILVPGIILLQFGIQEMQLLKIE